MSAASLRLDQSPPFSVPLRFFLTAPFFPLLAALLLAWQGPAALASRWSPAMLALTHLFTLGFLTMIMIGALMQLLPVLAGAPIARPKQVGASVHALLTLGTLLLVAGFLASPLLLRVALILLGIGLVMFIHAAGSSLWRAAAGSPTVKAMSLALAGLALTAALGISLGLFLVRLSAGTAKVHLVNLHVAWGLIGWVCLLMFGVAYQVVPMFQLTPPYPGWITRYLAPLLFVLLLLAFMTKYFFMLISLGLGAFAVVTLHLQKKRRRRLPDVTTRFWQLAMTSLLGCVIMGLISSISREASPRLNMLLGVWMIIGFASSAIHGMLYKIVPFLAWLHLHEQNIRYVLPNMKEILPDSRTAPHLWVHVAALVLISTAIMHPAFWVYPAAASMALSYGWLASNLWSAVSLYRRALASAVNTRVA